MKKIFIFFVVISFIFAQNCNKKLFTLKIDNPIPLKTILKELSDECDLNIIIKDKESYKLINSKIDFLNIKNEPLKILLDILFDSKNLFYSLNNNILTISYYKTKTFKVNYIPSTISGNADLNSTTNNIKTNYSFDFWSVLKKNITEMLKNTSSAYKTPIIDKNAGLVTITGTKEQLGLIQNYLEKLNKSLGKEVLIDVHIYSVELSASHQTGIDWSKLSLALNAQNVPLRARYLGGSESVFNGATFNLNGFLNFLAQNGNVNSISNPKIVTLNSQKAIISIGDTIYYKYASEITTDNNGNPTTQYTISSKFVGVLLDITPQISDNGEIILNINPKISSFKDITQLNNPKRDMPPDTKDNTLMSVVKLKNNETLVLGGLITNDERLRVNGIPVLKEIPLIKYLFSSREKVTNKKELVFVITPHIINLNSKTTLKSYGFKKIPSLEDLDVK